MIFTEYLKGGELQQYIDKRKSPLSEEEAKIAIVQLINGIHYCHK